MGGSYKKNLFTKFLFQPSRFKNTLKKFIKPTAFVKIIFMRLSSIFRSEPEQIDEEVIEQLKEHFKNDVENLKNLNINVSKWNVY